jgi:hypothetical protein
MAANYKVTWNPLSGATGYLVEFKADTDTNYTTPSDTPNPTLNTFYDLTLTPGTAYTVRLTSFINGKRCTPVLTQLTAAGGGVVTFEWQTDAFTCEQEVGFTLQTTYTGFVSPTSIFWEDTLGRFVVIDFDDPNGLVYTINPLAFTGYADRTVIAGTGGSQTRIGADYDFDNRRAWYAGDFTGGVRVVDIVGNNTTLLPYGTGGNFTKMLVKILGTNVYCSSRANSSSPSDIIIFDKNNPSFPPLTKTNASIPSGNIYFADAFTMTKVGNELWIGAAQRGNGDIARYSLDLSSFFGTVVLPGKVIWTSSKYWQGHYFDEPKNKYYVMDSGSNNMYVIDTSDEFNPLVIHTEHIKNRRDKMKGVYNFVRNELTDELYFSGNDQNDTSGSGAVARTYLIDRDNFAFKYIYPNIAFGSLKNRFGTNELWGVNAGQIYTQTGGATPSDGSILKFTM